MSRVGKKPVPVPKGVDVQIGGGELKVKGAKGELRMALVDEVEIAREGEALVAKPREASKRARALWGLQRSLMANMMTGVTAGFTREMEIQGVGYRAAVQGKNLNLQLGYSHDVVYPIPEGIQIVCEKPTSIKVSGIDRQKVGQVAAEIRGYRPPEPYKGKGIRYVGEYVFRKEGKKK
jgi:large subunit ribosomal protein L6